MHRRNSLIRLKGGSLVEVLMALSILSISLMIAFSLMTHLSSSASPSQQFQNRVLMRAAFFDSPSKSTQKGREIIRAESQISPELRQVCIQIYHHQQLQEQQCRILNSTDLP